MNYNENQCNSLHSGSKNINFTHRMEGFAQTAELYVKN